MVGGYLEEGRSLASFLLCVEECISWGDVRSLITLSSTQSTLQFSFSTGNSSFRPCIPDLNLNNSLLPASLTPCKYFLNPTLIRSQLLLNPSRV